MTTNFRNSGGSDFDDVFDLNQSGQYASDVNMRTSDGTDLARRYEIASYGSVGADVNMRTSAGIDVASLWAKKGSAVYSLAFNGKAYGAYMGSNTGASGSTTASRSVTINSDGTWTVSGSGTLTNGGATSGTWLPSGQSASDYQVQFVGAPSWQSYPAGGASSNGAASYVAATTSRQFTISATVLANSANDCIGSVAITVNLKRISTGAVTASTITLSVESLGWN